MGAGQDHMVDKGSIMASKKDGEKLVKPFECKNVVYRAGKSLGERLY